MKKLGVVAVLTLLLCAFSVAQEAARIPVNIFAFPSGSITVTIAGLSCTTSAGASTFDALSWNLNGGQTATTTAAGGEEGTKLSTLTVRKDLDTCSAALFSDAATAKALPSVVLTQTGGKSKTLIHIKLKNAMISSFSIGGINREIPTETLTFSFAAIEIEYQ